MKYFGIGWHKTGTTSLTRAFEILGFRSIHHPYQMFPEYMRGEREYSSLEWYEFASDSVIPMVFKEIDLSYSEAKFILTIRDKESWLQSVEEHFRRGNEKRSELGGKSWWELNDKERHIFDIYDLQYGRSSFDKDVFARAYDSHNLEVVEHFKNRQEDLLVMNLDDRSFGWEKLCEFLNLPIPQEEFPHERRTKEGEGYYFRKA